MSWVSWPPRRWATTSPSWLSPPPTTSTNITPLPPSRSPASFLPVCFKKILELWQIKNLHSKACLVLWWRASRFSLVSETLQQNAARGGGCRSYREASMQNGILDQYWNEYLCAIFGKKASVSRRTIIFVTQSKFLDKFTGTGTSYLYCLRKCWWCWWRHHLSN